MAPADDAHLRQGVEEEGRKKIMLNILLKGTVSLFCIILIASGAAAAEPDATEIVGRALDQMRGKTSESVSSMIIHRPDWERKMTIKGYTEGREKSIFWILSPAKDAGNGTLKVGTDMWTYNPKINRVIKLPPSMMSQSWMGSDFSNNDLARSDTVVEDYEHHIVKEKTVDGKKVYVIESPAKPTAPVIWGKLGLEIREDGILLSEVFYDQDGAPVKRLETLEIDTRDNRLIPVRMKMTRADEPEKYTLLIYEEVDFDVDLPPNLFTRAALKNPRR